ncbi:DNA polymerase-3 subunit delta' [Ruminococcus sp. YE71]|uniref:DNA polymerase III subunit n=1 Tax=unclassified Ruminococcus TaxID=2608920 RepID=UPI0008866551|nr:MULTISPECIES: hypothetical protein [unclassified Ruminococcus]SDA12477.1 DNA polymerase-3 subunit delta' [Ruminococcus sp. YE78]SFW16982.1 DNA polymerase-3 subunit delta' [Ruminococcus sp. YE71]
MINFIGNETQTELTARLIAADREPHSVIICGEHGLGKRTLAKVLASQLLCERGDGTFCGQCRACRLIEQGQHPDVMTVQSSDTGNYKVEDIRAVVSDAVVSPNEARLKVYIIPDLDRSRQTLIQVQNILLKLIEEPPDHTVMILTARSKETFLATIISRTLHLTVEETEPAQTAAYLAEQGCDPQLSEEAVRRCGGNIGACLDYVSDEKVRKLADIAAAAVQALAENDEYELLKLFTMADQKRDSFIRLMTFMQRAVRDALRIHTGTQTPYVFSQEACKALAAKRSTKRLTAAFDILGDFSGRASANCLTSILVNALTAALIKS